MNQYPREISLLKRLIGDEHMAMSNTSDTSIIRETAQAIKLLSQELMEACDQILDQIEEVT